MKKRAIISVYDKEGIVNFAKGLESLGWEIVSTGGSLKVLRAAGVSVVPIEEVTGFPEILDGRVKTLNPYIHGGILFKRGNEDHRNTMEEKDIKPVDMVVNNLYPFEEMLKKGVSEDEMMENIDIGGPSMIRAAGKNYKDVLVVTGKEDYRDVLERLQNEDLDLEYRRELARKAFNYTAYYDGMVSSYFNSTSNNASNNLFPEKVSFPYKKVDNLRYGENPHQRAAFYKEVNSGKGTMSDARQIHGKKLSFNNINDSNGAIKILKEFEEPTVVGVKHTNPSGIGSGRSIEEAFDKMYSCDSESIFGGIIASNREVNEASARRISKIFIEVVLAPSFSKDAIKILSEKENIRLLEIEDIGNRSYSGLDMKKTIGGVLVQETNSKLLDECKLVTSREPSQQEWEDLLFAFKCVKHISSNGVVIVKDQGTLGFGLGEVNRFWASKKAIERSGAGVVGSVLASDGFFPFKDSIEELGRAGIKAIIQPGGSIKDKEVIEEADKYGIAMVFTHTRHFKH